MIAATDQKVDSALIWGTALDVGADAELGKALSIPDGLKPTQVLRLDMPLFPMKRKRNLN